MLGTDSYACTCTHSLPHKIQINVLITSLRDVFYHPETAYSYLQLHILALHYVINYIQTRHDSPEKCLQQVETTVLPTNNVAINSMCGKSHY